MIKKVLLSAFLISILLLSSCKHQIDFTKEIKVITDYKGNFSDLWLFSLTNYLVGVDPETIETKLVVDFPIGVVTPVTANNKIYLGETYVFGWENVNYGVIVLDENLKFVKEIDAVPNIGRLYVYDNLLFTDCWSVDKEGKSAFSVIDLNTDELVYEYYDFPFLPSNAKYSCWGYDGKVYLGNQYRLNGPKFEITIVNTNPIEVIETTDRFTKDYPYEDGNLLVNKNNLWIAYIFNGLICIYDLDTNEKILSIDLRKYVPEYKNKSIELGFGEDEPIVDELLYRIVFTRLIDDTYYIIACDPDLKKDNELLFNAIIEIDANTFEFKEIIRLDKTLETVANLECLEAISDMRISSNNPDIIFLRNFNHVYELSRSTGSILKDIVVFDEE